MKIKKYISIIKAKKFKKNEMINNNKVHGLIMATVGWLIDYFPFLLLILACVQWFPLVPLIPLV